MSADETIAEALFLSVPEVHERLGVDWTEMELLEPDHERRWFLTGNPAQLMLGVGTEGVTLAIPRGQWDGVASLRYEPRDKVPVDVRNPESLERTRADLLRRRRSTFRYCRMCLALTAPEHRDGDTCHSCMARFLSVVF